MNNKANKNSSKMKAQLEARLEVLLSNTPNIAGEILDGISRHHLGKFMATFGYRMMQKAKFSTALALAKTLSHV